MPVPPHPQRAYCTDFNLCDNGPHVFSTKRVGFSETLMPSPKQQFPWPDYLPGRSDDLLALGVIALMYGQLESMFQHVFSAVTSLNEIQASAIFQRIPNNVRQDILFQMMAQTTLPDQLKEEVQHFGLGFKTCAANRHAIMHSHSAGVFTSVPSPSRHDFLNSPPQA
jgi:hypothetical protein